MLCFTLLNEKFEVLILNYFPKNKFLTLEVFFLMFQLHHTPCGIWVPQPGIKLMPLDLAAQSLNHWTAREFPEIFFFLWISIRKYIQELKRTFEKHQRRVGWGAITSKFFLLKTNTVNILVYFFPIFSPWLVFDVLFFMVVRFIQTCILISFTWHYPVSIFKVLTNSPCNYFNDHIFYLVVHQ